MNWAARPFLGPSASRESVTAHRGKTRRSRPDPGLAQTLLAVPKSDRSLDTLGSGRLAGSRTPSLQSRSSEQPFSPVYRPKRTGPSATVSKQNSASLSSFSKYRHHEQTKHQVSRKIALRHLLEPSENRNRDALQKSLLLAAHPEPNKLPRRPA
jgi:hypothetical protein